MKKILFLLVLMCLEKALHAQYVYTIKADSVKITNTCDTAELIIENHTQTVPGFLFNRGRGRTEFRRIAQLDDTSVVVGGDTIHLGRGNRNFANADLTFDGDHWHDGALHNVGLYNFNQIGFQANDVDFNNNIDMSLSQNNGYNLYVSKNTGDDASFDASHKVRNGRISMGVAGTTDGLFGGTQFYIGKKEWLLQTDATNFLTGEQYWGNFSYAFDSERKNSWLNLGTSNGEVLIGASNDAATPVLIRLNRGDSITFSTVTNLDTITKFIQTREGFTFRRLGNNLNFRIPGLPASASSTDSMLVVDNNGQVKKRPQPSTASSVAVVNGAVADVNAAVGTFTKLPDLSGSGSHSVILPSASSYSGQKIYIWNMNSSTNSWAFSSSVSLPNGTTTTSIPNQSTIELISDGVVWLKWN